ncbi:Hypothetical predicted protein [Paramuricea clavata]|uniref:Uncharacterized protein n=1 Tax=Paramuricea clavata TaxID=317549 RepID=A0A6S7KW58_PARCT|nr:Hypothetical predicted protein [Paramuricea clavata]
MGLMTSHFVAWKGYALPLIGMITGTEPYARMGFPLAERSPESTAGRLFSSGRTGINVNGDPESTMNFPATKGLEPDVPLNAKQV